MPKRTINKAAFVREMGHLSAKEVVQKAKSRGFTLTAAHVYAIRSADRSKRGKPAAARVPRARSGGGGGLNASIERLTKEFVASVLAAVRSSSLDDVLGR